jgi:glutathione S-transferase
MTAPVRIIGSYLSPYVRKVLVVLHLKGIVYAIDPIIPFMGDERFSKLSPLRRIPVLIDEQVTLADSTVICEYLEDRHPQPALYPRHLVQRARARWLEEFADTRMGDVFIWQLFNQVAINPFVWGQKTDEAALRKTLTEDIPQVLDYLEAELPPEGFLFGDVSVADISIAVFFRNAAFARFQVDAVRWPATAAFVRRVHALECFVRLMPFEERLIRTPIPRHREVLAEMQAPLMPESYGSSTPRRGVMRI